MKQRKEWLWWEPGWSFRPKLQKELEMFRNPWLWARLGLLSPAFLGLVFWLRQRFPDVEFPMSRLIPAILLLPSAIMAAPILLLWWLPPFVSISRKGVLVMHGQSARWFLADQIQSVLIILQVPERPLLRVSTDAATGTYGIGAKVSVADLEAFIREVLPQAKCERVAT